MPDYRDLRAERIRVYLLGIVRDLMAGKPFPNIPRLEPIRHQLIEYARKRAANG